MYERVEVQSEFCGHREVFIQDKNDNFQFLCVDSRFLEDGAIPFPPFYLLIRLFRNIINCC